MSDHQTISCLGCGTEFELTPQYLAEYGGQTTACSCGKPLDIPTAEARGKEPIQLS